MSNTIRHSDFTSYHAYPSEALAERSSALARSRALHTSHHAHDLNLIKERYHAPRPTTSPCPPPCAPSCPPCCAACGSASYTPRHSPRYACRHPGSHTSGDGSWETTQLKSTMDAVAADIKRELRTFGYRTEITHQLPRRRRRRLTLASGRRVSARSTCLARKQKAPR
jgi:hypothetical protein